MLSPTRNEVQLLRRLDGCGIRIYDNGHDLDVQGDLQTRKRPRRFYVMEWHCSSESGHGEGCHPVLALSWCWAALGGAGRERNSRRRSGLVECCPALPCPVLSCPALPTSCLQSPCTEYLSATSSSTHRVRSNLGQNSRHWPTYPRQLSGRCYYYGVHALCSVLVAWTWPGDPKCSISSAPPGVVWPGPARFSTSPGGEPASPSP